MQLPQGEVGPARRPDGGDGRELAGDVILKASTRFPQLLDLQYQQQPCREKTAGTAKAAIATSEMLPLCHQISGRNDREGHDNEAVLCDLDRRTGRKRLSRRWTRGRANSQFASATNRVPMQHEDGELGEEHWFCWS